MPVTAVPNYFFGIRSSDKLKQFRLANARQAHRSSRTKVPPLNNLVRDWMKSSSNLDGRCLVGTNLVNAGLFVS